MRASLCMLGLACALTACATGPDKPDAQPAVAAVIDPYPSTYRAPNSPPILIRSATVLTGATSPVASGRDTRVAFDGSFFASGAALRQSSTAETSASMRPSS